MREISSAEYRVVASILDRPDASDLERIREAGVPSSTFNVVRRRIWEAGWLRDIWIPEPGPSGFATVEIELSRPSVTDRPEFLEARRRDPECVLLWAGVHAVLAIHFRRAERPDAAPERSEALRLRIGPGAGAVPAYFDFSGLWSRFGGRPAPAAYPRSLDLAGAPLDARSRAVERAWLAAGEGGNGTSSWTSRARLSRPHRRLLERGAVSGRSVLRPERLPSLDGRRLGEYVFVHGALRPGATVAGLLGELNAECRTSPFLAAEAQGRALLVGIGQLRTNPHGRELVAAARRPVLPVLREHLDPVEVLVEPTEALALPVAHDYSGRR